MQKCDTKSPARETPRRNAEGQVYDLGETPRVRSMIYDRKQNAEGQV